MLNFRFWLLLFSLAAFALHNGLAHDRPAKKTADATRKIRNKTLDEWIAQAKDGRKLEDRHAALQILRSGGLNVDRKKTLRAFTELLSDKVPTVQSLAAAGLRTAGKPTDPKAPDQLVKILSKDMVGLKPRVFRPGKADKSDGRFGRATRAITALAVIGEAKQVPALRRVSENKKLHPILRKLSSTAIRQIEK